jgi:pimeloyl-ACP methyl ester carboxylesterase
MIDFTTWCQNQNLSGYGTKQFKLPNGESYSVHFCDAQNRTTSPARISILFLHGTGNDAWFPQAHLINLMTQSGVNFFSIQLPGHGHYDTSILRFEELGTFVLEAIRQITAVFGVQKFVLGGQSLGAIAVAQMIGRTDNLPGLAGAFFVTMPLKPDLKLRTAIPEILLPFFAGFWQLTKYYGLISSVPAFGWFRRREFPVRMNREAHDISYLRYICESISKQNWGIKLKSVRIPLLAIYAQYDRIAPPGDGAQLKNDVPDLSISVIRSENHFSIMGSDQLPVIINQWIDRISSHE